MEQAAVERSFKRGRLDGGDAGQPGQSAIALHTTSITKTWEESNAKAYDKDVRHRERRTLQQQQYLLGDGGW